jgi:hypothetical protein
MRKEGRKGGRMERSIYLFRLVLYGTAYPRHHDSTLLQQPNVRKILISVNVSVFPIDIPKLKSRVRQLEDLNWAEI